MKSYLSANNIKRIITACPNCIATGNPRASKSPITYLNRLWLKHTLKKRENPAAARERTYSAQ